MSGANGSDDLWLVVKCLSSLEIAGSLRNSFTASLSFKFNVG